MRMRWQIGGKDACRWECRGGERPALSLRCKGSEMALLPARVAQDAEPHKSEAREGCDYETCEKVFHCRQATTDGGSWRRHQGHEDTEPAWRSRNRCATSALATATGRCGVVFSKICWHALTQANIHVSDTWPKNFAPPGFLRGLRCVLSHSAVLKRVFSRVS